MFNKLLFVKILHNYNLEKLFGFWLSYVKCVVVEGLKLNKEGLKLN